MSRARLSIIIVNYNTGRLLKDCLDSIYREATTVPFDIWVVDNHSTDTSVPMVRQNFPHVKLIENKENVGFAKANNQAIKKCTGDYVLLLNPDILVLQNAVEKTVDFMENNPDIGLAMPKILYPDGSIQYLCKLLPAPMDLIWRRFFPASKYLDKKNSLYELRFTGYDKMMDVPYLSGCFMFIRTTALRRVGLFDERFFMYMEDLDLSRRIHKHYRTVYYPKVCVFHQYEKGSYHNWKLLGYHLLSAIKYFNKWGYFFDKDRQEINKTILKKLNAL